MGYTDIRIFGFTKSEKSQQNITKHSFGRNVIQLLEFRIFLGGEGDH